MPNDLIIGIVTYNHQKYILQCIASIKAQVYPNIKTIILDNGSSDRTVEVVEKEYPDIEIITNKNNIGFAGGHNKLLQSTNSKYYMALNPDVLLSSTFVAEKVKVMKQVERVGMVSGKLFKIKEEKGAFIKTSQIDSTGIILKKNRKNYDRDYGVEDKGQRDCPGLVFGAYGAAPLYLREMLEDISIEKEYFDEDFFCYREEVDLAWRAQLRNWKSYYTPKAVAYHVRGYSPCNRSTQPLLNRRYQFRNRYLMIIKNETIYGLLCHFPYIYSYELLALGYVCIFEPRLLSGYIEVVKLFNKMLKKRKWIMMHKKISSKKFVELIE